MRMRTAIGAALVLALTIPIVSSAEIIGGAECRVLSDAGGHVTGPLGTARPSQNAGREIDLKNVSMRTDASALHIKVSVTDLNAKPSVGTAFYGIFWSHGSDRYFAQAANVDGSWTFQAGRAAGESLPQQGRPENGAVAADQNSILIDVFRVDVDAASFGAMLEQIRGSSQESASRMSVNGHSAVPPSAAEDHIGGADGARYLADGPCLPAVSGAAERCLVTTNPAHRASAGIVPATDMPAAPAMPGAPAMPAVPAPVTAPVPAASTPNPPHTAFGTVDPATEIDSLQMGSNLGTLIVEAGVGSLAGPVPTGADAERWVVSWKAAGITYSAFAERHSQGALFGYNDGTHTWPTTGSIDATSGTVRILVPRHEISADDPQRITSIFAQSFLVAGPLQDARDAAPAAPSFSTQFIIGVSCADQQKAACPVIFDPDAEAVSSVSSQQPPDPENQPASDVTAVGASAPDGTLVLSLRVANIGSPPPAGFDTQGWTVSWAYRGTRFVAQAERQGSTTQFFSAALGPATTYAGPAGAYQTGPIKAATGSFDAQSGTISIVIPRADVDDPADGDSLSELGARAWIASSQQVAGHYAPARRYQPVDTTKIAPYHVGLACSA